MTELPDILGEDLGYLRGIETVDIGVVDAGVVDAGVVRGSVGLGMSGHSSPHRGANDEWLTPPAIIAALGPFDLDPCAPVVRPWPTAATHHTIVDDGLAQSWPDDAFVWCNPPYGPQTWRWLERVADHPAGGVCLIFARTETEGFHAQVWQRADAVLFVRGRLHFHRVDGSRSMHNSGAPSVLVGYGPEAVVRLRACGLDGHLVACATPDRGGPHKHPALRERPATRGPSRGLLPHGRHGRTER